MKVVIIMVLILFFFSSRRRHTRYIGDWSSDVCSSDLPSEALFPRVGCADNLEAQHIPVKRDGRMHVENLQQRRHPPYLNGHVILLLNADDFAPSPICWRR